MEENIKQCYWNREDLDKRGFLVHKLITPSQLLTILKLTPWMLYDFQLNYKLNEIDDYIWHIYLNPQKKKTFKIERGDKINKKEELV